MSGSDSELVTVLAEQEIGQRDNKAHLGVASNKGLLILPKLKLVAYFSLFLKTKIIRPQPQPAVTLCFLHSGLVPQIPLLPRIRFLCFSRQGLAMEPRLDLNLYPSTSTSAVLGP